MKITIDTTQDSKRDIQEAIRLLNSLMNQSEDLTSSESSTGIVGDANPDMFSMFDDKKEDTLPERTESLRIVEY